MKQTLFLVLFVAYLFPQCSKKNDPVPQHGPIREIDVIDISIDGVDSKDITVDDSLIVIHLPENHAGGDYIKPHITFGNGYSTRSELVNGFSYVGKELSLPVESTTRPAHNFKIVVIPHNSITLTEPERDYQLTLNPGAGIEVPIELHGTALTLNDSGKIVQNPAIVLKDRATGAVAHWFYPQSENWNNGRKLTLSLPATVATGTYTAEVVWGAETEVLSRNLTIRPGQLQLRRDRWYMLPSTREFTLTGYNISKEGKYELTISNDHTAAHKVPMHFKNAGTLTGVLPADMQPGNYKVTYWKDGKVVEPYDEKIGLDKYMGDDQFYIKKETDQPLLRIISQPSRIQYFTNDLGMKFGYYPSFVDISRKEPLIAYRERAKPFLNRNDLVLVDAQNKKTYSIPYSGDIYTLFGGFMVFLGYNIPSEVPAGKYEAYIATDSDETEKYSQLINIRDN